MPPIKLGVPGNSVNSLDCSPLPPLMQTPNACADFSFKPVEWNDESQLYGETMALKQQNPNLKVLIAVGGWTMNDVRLFRGHCAAAAAQVYAKAGRVWWLSTEAAAAGAQAAWCDALTDMAGRTAPQPPQPA